MGHCVNLIFPELLSPDAPAIGFSSKLQFSVAPRNSWWMSG
jgi:hypothetical protein